MYSQKVMEHFSNPRNVGKMPSADGIGVVGDVRCGDQLTLYIKVKEGVITETGFLVFGCTAAIATSSMTTELAKNKTIEEAMQITEQDIIDALDGLPPVKHHCSNMGVAGLRAAIADYELKKSLPVMERYTLKVKNRVMSAREDIVNHMMVKLHGKKK